MKTYRKFFVLPFIYGIIFSWHCYFRYSNAPSVGDVLSEFDGGYWSNARGEGLISNYISLFVPFFMFVFVFSTYIYRHFCNSSVYVFSRCENRYKWFLKESAKLFIYTAINTLTVLIGFFIMGLVTGRLRYSTGDINILLWYYFMYTLWAYQIVLMANIIAFYKGSTIGVAISMAIQLMMGLFLSVLPEKNFSQMDTLKAKLCPLAYLGASWYENPRFLPEIFRKTGSEPVAVLAVSSGFIIMTLFVLVTLVAGMIAVEKVDIIESDKEV